MIIVPTGQVVQGGWYAAGLHRGSVKMAFGILSLVETGFVLPDVYDNPNRHAWLNDSHGFVKLGGSVLPSAWWAPGVGVGAENSAARLADIVGIKSHTIEGAENLESVYAVGTWWWKILGWPMEASVGAGTGRFERKAFGAFSVIPASLLGNTVKFSGEYAGQQACVGARVALSRTLRLDFAMLLHAIQSTDNRAQWSITIDRGTMGASQSGPISWNWLRSKPKEPPRR